MEHGKHTLVQGRMTGKIIIAYSNLPEVYNVCEAWS